SWAIGLALAVEFFARLPGVCVGLGQLLRGTAAGVIAAFVVPATWQGAERWWVPAFAGAIAGPWAPVAAGGRAAPGGSLAAAMAVACAGTSAVLLHHASAGFSDVATFGFAALAALALLAWLTGLDVSAAAAPATVLNCTLLLIGRALIDSQVPRA